MEETPRMEKPVRTTIYLPPSLWKAAKIKGIEKDTTATQIVVWALEQYLGKKGER